MNCKKIHKVFINSFLFQKSTTASVTPEIGGKSLKNPFKAINIGSYQEIFPSFYPLPMMERGLDGMTDSTGLCLQDLVGATNGTNSNQNSNSNQNNASDHLHHHHHNLHDSVRHDSISVSSAISNLMPTTVGSIGSGLSHLHHSAHVDLNHHHHHITSPHTPSVLHEPLEKLKCKL